MGKILLNKFQTQLAAALSGWFFTTEHCILLHIKDVLNLWRKTFYLLICHLLPFYVKVFRSSVFKFFIVFIHQLFHVLTTHRTHGFPQINNQLHHMCWVISIWTFLCSHDGPVTVNKKKAPKYPGNKWHCWPRCYKLMHTWTETMAHWAAEHMVVPFVYRRCSEITSIHRQNPSQSAKTEKSFLCKKSMKTEREHNKS